MRTLFLGILGMVLLFSDYAFAETRNSIYSSGSWVLYSANEVDVSYPGRSKRVLDNMCLAEFASDTATGWSLEDLRRPYDSMVLREKSAISELGLALLQK